VAGASPVGGGDYQNSLRTKVIKTNHIPILVGQFEVGSNLARNVRTRSSYITYWVVTASIPRPSTRIRAIGRIKRVYAGSDFITVAHTVSIAVGYVGISPKLSLLVGE
jgi:hypothetical protein